MKVIKNTEDLWDQIESYGNLYVKDLLFDGLNIPAGGATLCSFRDCMFKNCTFSFENYDPRIFLEGKCFFSSCELSDVEDITIGNGGLSFDKCSFDDISISEKFDESENNAMNSFLNIINSKGNKVSVCCRDQKEYSKKIKISIINNNFIDFYIDLPYYYSRRPDLYVDNNKIDKSIICDFLIDSDVIKNQFKHIIDNNNIGRNIFKSVMFKHVDLTNFDMGSVKFMAPIIRNCKLSGCDFSKCKIDRLIVRDNDLSDIKQAVFGRKMEIAPTNGGTYYIVKSKYTA